MKQKPLDSLLDSLCGVNVFHSQRNYVSLASHMIVPVHHTIIL